MIFISKPNRYIEDVREKDKDCELYEAEVILEVKQKRTVYAKDGNHAEELLSNGEWEDKDTISEEIIVIDNVKISE